MKNENDLIQKLMISKQIMNKHKEIPRGQQINGNIISEVEEFNSPPAKYELPQDIIQESSISNQNIKMPKATSKDKILSSKLPDEVKMLMIEHPIHQPDNMTGPSISNDLAEKASRLMNLDAKGDSIKPQKQINPSFNFDMKMLKQMMRETMEEILHENGLIVESTSKTNEQFSFRVGEHIFEGKLTKIKKISK